MSFMVTEVHEMPGQSLASLAHTLKLGIADFFGHIPSAWCGPPPEVENARVLGNRKERYSVSSAVRYKCNLGFRQRHQPVVRCIAGGQWERPRVECVNCECAFSPFSTIPKRITYKIKLLNCTGNTFFPVSDCIPLSPAAQIKKKIHSERTPEKSFLNTRGIQKKELRE